ncbi:hypothetical protein [Brevundimonas bacteroides]|uniref:hypothetical protein n=1 Tax=Brevundimonas bacteroides TaxID=74311 RepID=UPI0004976F1B|nr:hypothetical protein [Brevundimonas bacteroides]
MVEIRNQVLEGRQELDGNTCYACEFRDAMLVFRGVQQPGFSNCRFTRSRFAFEGPAANTVHFLRGMLGRQSGMRGFVTGMMPEIEG